MTRDNTINLVVGRRGAGKTDFCKKEIILPTQLPKTLIVDTFDNPVWRTMKIHDRPDLSQVKIPILMPKDILNWQKGVYRCITQRPQEVFEIIARDLWNCNLLIEDASRFLRGKVSEEVSEFLFNSKQRNIDITLAYHSLRQVPPEVVDSLDYITLFKTADGKLNPEKYPDPMLQEIVNALKKAPKYTCITHAV